jgi:hypothetical protein
MNIKAVIPLSFILNYFTIFFICYIVKEYSSISQYPGFFIQYFLLAVSLLFYVIRIYEPTLSIFQKPALSQPKKLKVNYNLYFIYQLLFTLYTVIASFAVPQYIFLTSQSYWSILSAKSYIAYLCSTGILCIIKLKVLHSQYTEENEFVPYYIV